MIQIDLNAKIRVQFGKGASRSLRRAGKTPAVLYGPKLKTTALDLDSRNFTKSLLMLQRRNAVVSITIEGEGGKSEVRNSIIKEIQTDPVRNTLVHADFMEIPMDTPMALNVPIHLTGNAKGVELGGEVNTPKSFVSLKGLILDIPDFIEVDVTSMDIGDKVSCQDLNIPDNLTLIDKADQVCVSVNVASRVEEENEGGDNAEAEGAEDAASESTESAE